MIHALSSVLIEGVTLSPTARTGALIVYAPQTPAWAERMVHLFAGVDPYDFTERQTESFALHRINGDDVLAAVFPSVHVGMYRAHTSGMHAQVSCLTISSYEITELHWHSIPTLDARQILKHLRQRTRAHGSTSS